MTIRGRTPTDRLCALLMKLVSIFSVYSKSAITPSFMGRTRTILPGVRPSMALALLPTASTSPVFWFTARMEGSRTTIPRPLQKTSELAVPRSMARSLEKRAVRESATNAKAAEVYLVEQSMMAAIGAGLPIAEPIGSMVLDIGGGTSDVAVISMAGIVYSKVVRVAGNKMDEAVSQYIKRKYNLLIGERTAEEIKIKIGSAFPLDEERTMEVKGRDLVQGIPKSITISDEEIREALAEPIATIIEAVRAALEQTPPELAADIVDRGIVLTGGGALLEGLDARLREETGLPVSIANEPLTSVVMGTGKVLDDYDLLTRIALG